MQLNETVLYYIEKNVFLVVLLLCDIAVLTGRVVLSGFCLTFRQMLLAICKCCAWLRIYEQM